MPSWKRLRQARGAKGHDCTRHVAAPRAAGCAVLRLVNSTLWVDILFTSQQTIKKLYMVGTNGQAQSRSCLCTRLRPRSADDTERHVHTWVRGKPKRHVDRLKY